MPNVNPPDGSGGVLVVRWTEPESPQAQRSPDGRDNNQRPQSTAGRSLQRVVGCQRAQPPEGPRLLDAMTEQRTRACKAYARSALGTGTAPCSSPQSCTGPALSFRAARLLGGHMVGAAFEACAPSVFLRRRSQLTRIHGNRRPCGRSYWPRCPGNRNQSPSNG